MKVDPSPAAVASTQSTVHTEQVESRVDKAVRTNRCVVSSTDPEAPTGTKAFGFVTSERKRHLRPLPTNGNGSALKAMRTGIPFRR